MNTHCRSGLGRLGLLPVELRVEIYRLVLQDVKLNVYESGYPQLEQPPGQTGKDDRKMATNGWTYLPIWSTSQAIQNEIDSLSLIYTCCSLVCTRPQQMLRLLCLDAEQGLNRIKHLEVQIFGPVCKSLLSPGKDYAMREEERKARVQGLRRMVPRSIYRSPRDFGFLPATPKLDGYERRSREDTLQKWLEAFELLPKDVRNIALEISNCHVNGARGGSEKADAHLADGLYTLCRMAKRITENKVRIVYGKRGPEKFLKDERSKILTDRRSLVKEIECVHWREDSFQGEEYERYAMLHSRLLTWFI
ncbi:hypothetical protein MMC20_003493 [Loxospora ochrophaea]|nr:hypothetical protein [Loxospora ochrophaea]